MQTRNVSIVNSIGMHILKRAGRGLLPAMGLIAAILTLAPRELTSPDVVRQQIAAGQLVGPNVMIVLGNGYSMNREMDDVTYPYVATPSDPFVDEKNPAVTFPSVRWQQERYSEQPSSKFYQAKQAITSIMDDNTLSANVNVGLATWRTTFAQPVYAISQNAQWIGGRLYPIDQDILSAPTPKRYKYAEKFEHFSAVDVPMYPNAGNTGACPSTTISALTQDRQPGQIAIVGKDACDGGKGVINESVANYITGKGGVGGIPRVIVPGYPNLLAPLTVSGATSLNLFPAPNNMQYNAGLFFERGDLPPNQAHFCGSGYNSEYNYFGAGYVLDYAYTTGIWNDLHDFRSRNFDASGEIVDPPYLADCSGVTKNVNTKIFRRGNKVRDSVTSQDRTVLGVTNMPFYVWAGSIGQQIPNGALNGWSGENKLVDGAQPTEVMSASYPSGPAAAENPAIAGRFLLSKGLVKSTVSHMGPFLDLPDPAAGYVDQRQTIRDFMITKQMDATGLEYDPLTQKIAPNAAGKSTKGLRASDGGSDGQSPVYDSLLGANAYYSAYKKADPNDACRSNHVLLLYDGRENSRYYVDPVTGQPIWADPSEVSRRMKADLNVFTHVIIISRVSGDIEEANKIALEGGTTQAYVIGDYTQLQVALRNVFGALQSQIATTSPAVPLFVRGGDTAYSPVTYSTPSYGTLEAHAIQANGLLDPGKAWDANEKMTLPLRKSNLFSSPGGTLVSFMSVPDATFVLPPASGLTATILKEITMDPSYLGGAYLAGRKQDTFIGRASNAPPAVLDAVMSPEISLEADYQLYTRGLSPNAKVVLFSSNDGFLYAINPRGAANEGELRWGWMPEQFLPRLKQYDSFQGTRSMDGDLRVADVKAGTTYNRYVLGVADKGRLHFGLELSDQGMLTRVAWTDDSASGPGDPKLAPDVVRVGGIAYAVYTRGTRLIIRNIATGALTEKSLANVSISGDVKGLHIARGQAFIGSAEGDVYSVGLFDASTPVLLGTMRSSGGGTINDVGVTSITSAVVQGAHHVTAQSNTRITVFSRALDAAASVTWDRLWSTSIAGADTAPGARRAPEVLPLSARLSAPAVIIEGVIFAPVTEDGAGVGTAKSCVAGAAKLYFFDLNTGVFPTDRIIDKSDGKSINANLSLGAGDALRIRLAQLEGGLVGGYASAQAGATGLGTGSALVAVKSPGTKIVWWKEVDRDQY
jgi:hypothetical protein